MDMKLNTNMVDKVINCLVILMLIVMVVFVLYQISSVVVKSSTGSSKKEFVDSRDQDNCNNYDYWGDYEGSTIVTCDDDDISSVNVNVFSPVEIKLFKGLIKKVEQQYGARIKRASKLFNQDEKLILAVIIVESRGVKTAKSSKGALGLMQIKPSTAVTLAEFKHLKYKNEVAKELFHPYKNILGGAEYLRYLEKRFKSQEALLAAYNMGPTKVSRLLRSGKFDPSEHRYVRKVQSILSII